MGAELRVRKPQPELGEVGYAVRPEAREEPPGTILGMGVVTPPVELDAAWDVATVPEECDCSCCLMSEWSGASGSAD